MDAHGNASLELMDRDRFRPTDFAGKHTVNQLADTAYALFTVLPDYGPPIWQSIPDQTIFQGQTFTNFDLDTYLQFGGNCHQFDFEVFPLTGTAPDPAWPAVAPGALPMTVIARVLFANQPLAGAGAKLAAFVNGNLAGTATPVGTAPNITYTLQLANVGTGPITFRFYDAEQPVSYTKKFHLTFVCRWLQAARYHHLI